MIKLTAKKNELLVSQGEKLTSGSVGIYTCQFAFSSDWDGLSKTAVFYMNDIKKSALLDSDNRCQIPWEVLEKPFEKLYAGVYGTRDGNIVLPTTWACLGEIQKGTIPGEASEEPTPGAYDQIVAIAQQLLEDADAGRFDGADGITPHIGENGNWWVETMDTGKPSRGAAGPQGLQGPAGPQGKHGVTPHIGENGNWWIGTEDTGKPSQSDSNTIVCDVSGEVVHIADPSRQQILGLTIYGKSTQNGEPAPENPAEIVSVGDAGEMTVTACGRNLFDIGTSDDYVPMGEIKYPVTVTGNRISAYVAASAVSHAYHKSFIPVWNQCVIAGKAIRNLEAPEGGRILVKAFDANHNEIREADLISGMIYNTYYKGYYAQALPFTATVKSDRVKYVQIGFVFRGTTGETGWFEDIVISYDSAAVDFEPYQGSTVTLSNAVHPDNPIFPLRGIPVTSGGNVIIDGQQYLADTLQVNADGTGTVVKRVRNYTLPSFSNFGSNYSNRAQGNLPDLLANTSPNNVYGLCNRFSYQANVYSDGSNSVGYCIGNKASNSLFVRFGSESTITTLEAANEWLVNNPLTVIYPLAVPETIALTAEEIQSILALQTYKPVTNVFNNESAWQTLTYVADTKAYIDNKFAQLAAQLVVNA